MSIILFILGGITGTTLTLLFTAKAISRAESETFNRCLKDAQQSFGREAWK